MTSPLRYPTVVDPPKPPRPAVVTIAFYLQLAAAVLLLVVVAMLIGRALHYDSLIDEAARTTHPDPLDVSSERAGNVFMTVLPGALCLLFAAGLAGLAVPVRRGSNVTRILTLVLSGLPVLLCFGPGCGLIGLPLAFLSGPGTGPGPFPDDPAVDPIDTSGSDQFWNALDRADAMPDVWVIVAALASALVAVALLVAFVLLFVPPAHRFFVPPRPATALLAYPGQSVGWPVGPPVTYGPPPGVGYPVYVYPVPPPAWSYQVPPPPGWSDQAQAPSAWSAPAPPSDPSPPPSHQGQAAASHGEDGQDGQLPPGPPGGSPLV